MVVHEINMAQTCQNSPLFLIQSDIELHLFPGQSTSSVTISLLHSDNPKTKLIKENIADIKIPTLWNQYPTASCGHVKMQQEYRGR